MIVSDIKQRIEQRLDQGLEGQWYIVAKSSDVADGIVSRRRASVMLYER